MCESICDTLLNVPGKIKDGLKSRMDLGPLKIIDKLAFNFSYKNHIKLPPTSYTLIREEKKMFCECLRSITIHDGYFSNMKNLVSLKECKLQGLKSHDCHVLVQQLLVLHYKQYYLTMYMLQ